MAAFNNVPSVTNTTAAVFIPELWSDEVIAAYEKSLVMAPLVRNLSMEGKKGDTIHIPKPVRGAASEKISEAQVTLQANTHTELVVSIDKHFEYSNHIEDITATQALASLRQFYTGDAGYALALQKDQDLFDLGKWVGDGTGADNQTSNSFTDTAGVLSPYVTGVGADFTDAGFRNLIQKMDDADVPMDGRKFVIAPAVRNAIMGIDRYVSSDFVNGRGVVNGKIGELYGIDIYVSTNVPTETGARGNFLFHSDTYLCVNQKGVRSQTQYQQEYLATLYTADTLYGTSIYRPESGFTLWTE